MKKTQLQRIVRHLKYLAKNDYNKLLQNDLNERKFQTYVRKRFPATQAGRFIPQGKVGQPIKKGQKIGRLKQKNSAVTVSSPYSGIILSISYERSIKKNDQLFVIGKRV